MKNLLITGGAGFIGSNFIPYFLKNHSEYKLINLDSLSYAGDLGNLMECEGHDRYEFIHGDICDLELVQEIFRNHDIRGVIHFAAESHVDNSIARPGVFIETNVKGTYNLLQSAKEHWSHLASERNADDKGCRFLHISTDEVYGSLGETGYFTETTPYAPNSPYSASKASADMIVRSYYETYGLNTVITNCSNNFGPKQHDEKLIPTVIRKALSHEPIPIYGDGRNVRDWLYVEDHCRAIDVAFHRGRAGEVYNVGGDNEKDNLTLVDAICSILDHRSPSNEVKSYKHLITLVKDRAGHDRRYAVDSNKIKTELGWGVEEDFPASLLKTVEWYIQKYS